MSLQAKGTPAAADRSLDLRRWRIALNGAEIGASVPPERRRIGLLGQRAMLFPHLSALENVAFGPRAQGVPAAEARRRALEHLDEVGLRDLARHRPAELSGGQQQRVALARALAAEPLALLLDEPFASLDAETGTQARRLVARLREHLAIPIVLVTHDPLDAVMLATRTVVVDDGRIVQQGATAEVLGHPRSRFAAAIAGVNLVAGVGRPAGAPTTDPRDVDAEPGALVTEDGLRLIGRGDRLRGGETGSAVFSPASVRILPVGDDASDAASSAAGVNSWRSLELIHIMPSRSKAMRCPKWPLPLFFGTWRQITSRFSSAPPPLASSTSLARATADPRPPSPAST